MMSRASNDRKVSSPGKENNQTQPRGGSPAHQIRGREASVAGGVPWILLALFLIQFAFTFRPDALAWDGVFYYSYARSIVFDGDLNLGNDIALSYQVTPGQDFVSQRFDQVTTATGRVANPFAIGTALLWLPWYATIAGLVQLAVPAALPLGTAPGYELPLKWGMAAVTAVYGLVAIIVAYRFAQRFTSKWAALLASATAMFTTPLVYYQFRDAFFAHAASAMAVALFVAAWWQTKDGERRSLASAFLLGALGGVAALVRTQNITYLVLPLLTACVAAWPGLRARDRRALWPPIQRFIVTALGAAMVLTVQFSVWRILYGEWITVPQGQSFVDWRALWLWPVLFSSFHGLVPWMPLIIPALAGLVIATRRKPSLGRPLLVALALQVYVNSSVGDWYGGGGYGPRRFSSTLIILLIGYASLLNLRRDRWYRALGVAVSAVLVLHQWLILSYGFGEEVGGRVTDMTTAAGWQADGIGEFAGQLAGYVPEAIRNPLRTLVLEDSPIGGAGASTALFAGKFLVLAGALAGVYVLQLATHRAWNGRRSRTVGRWLVPLAVVGGVLVADWWLLTAA